MNLSRILYLACIIVGGVIAIYAQAEAQQNQYILIIGVVLLMFGVYGISRNIPSKSEWQQEDSFVQSEPENDDD